MRILKLSATVALGVLLSASVTIPAVMLKTAGRYDSCPWWKVLTMPLSANYSHALMERVSKQLSIVQTEPGLGIEQIRTPTRAFWIKVDTLRFSVGVSNSGTGSFVLPEVGRSQEMQVPVRPLDDILQSIGAAKVDFIKMDIEGAERDALKGAARTLRQFKPRLMMDM